jgi:hypothetical protein
MNDFGVGGDEAMGRWIAEQIMCGGAKRRQI